MSSNIKNSKPQPRRIGIVGSGIAGLSAAWALSKHHDVTLFDKNNYFGGHANTVRIDLQGEGFDVDTGFIVYNDVNYPHLVNLFDSLSVNTCASDMSFSASLDDGQFEYSGSGFGGLLAQRKNMVSPRFWRMLKGIRRFYKNAHRYMSEDLSGLTIGQLLNRENYSQTFKEDHLLPMASAIWSTADSDILAYPSGAFLRFFENHGLLRLHDRPQWRTVAGGSKQYVRLLLKDSQIKTHKECHITEVRREANAAYCHDNQGNVHEFDEIVMATHADEALALLKDPTALERKVLSLFKYSNNVACLHTDPALMPHTKKAWASWNYMRGHKLEAPSGVCITYWMNNLQPLPTSKDIFVTLNPEIPPKTSHIYGEYSYKHPIFSPQTDSAQSLSISLQGSHRTWYCGSYLGHGFHEDGIQSGLWVAGQLGSPPPWRDHVGYNRLPSSYD